MAIFARVHCGNCHGEFELYHKEINTQDSPARCPFCNQQMTEKQWETLSDCYHRVKDWNGQSRKASQEHGAPFFALDFRRRYVPKEKYIMSNDKN